MSAKAIRRRPRTKARRRKNREQQMVWVWPVLLLILAMITALLAVSCGKSGGDLSQVPRSAQRRSRLEGGSLRETAYVTDRADWLEENQDQALSGLRYFYEQTGVQPHIYIRSGQSAVTGNQRETMDGYAAALYGSLFSDDRHLLILVEQQETDGSLLYGFAPGKQAAAVMDQEALDILGAYWDNLLADSPEMAGGQRASAMGEAMEKTADNIMMVNHTGGWVWLLGFLVTGILLLAGLEFRKNWNRLKAEESHLRK